MARIVTRDELDRIVADVTRGPFVTQDELAQMNKAAISGEPFQPSSPYAEQVWEQVQRGVAEIRARGWIAEIPFDLP